ncbi:metabolite traffic protein EboE [Geomonas propionica]|uniref:Metabolite traffic protein EboE n=1 Tax=Geomonas propionica TaxID=2798582 RepID=A0ABS0YY96_9BACT|nr:metabolite traffic protein EboE [Geomonas propionica]MBJ6802727.1 metabolite traffic protein EboE [Geomonas propionica]
MLTYCTNIHRGESWEEVRTAVWPRVLEVKRRVFPDRPFPVGLRLSARAAREATPELAREFLEECKRNSCFVPTLNGFPYGAFHDTPVKEHAYLPDWREPARVEYTLDLVRLLALWLPEGCTGSISTLPVCYGPSVSREEFTRVREHLVLVLQELARHAGRGINIILALEPEPDCFLETCREVAGFVATLELPEQLRPHLGVCFDCCHAAVVLEEPREAFAVLAAARIPVAKIHVSSAIRLPAVPPGALAVFDEERYLHQATLVAGSDIRRFGDISHALAAPPPLSGEWLVHYHLPIFDDGNKSYGSTNAFIREVLSCRPRGALLEIETYIPEVSELPAEDLICREFDWLRSIL